MKCRRDNLEDLLTIALGTSNRDRQEDARALFEKIDENNSGTIDKNELDKFMRTQNLNNANIDDMMKAADSKQSDDFDFEEFSKCFKYAQFAATSDDVSYTVYLNMEWMVDVMKGIVRHDHAALLQYLRDEGNFPLVHQARRLRVQGIISNALLDNDFLWPVTKTLFWNKDENYKYERLLWDDGTKGSQEYCGECG